MLENLNCVSFTPSMGSRFFTDIYMQIYDDRFFLHCIYGSLFAKVSSSSSVARLVYRHNLENIFRFYAVLLRRNYVTPTSYLELIKTFKSLLGKKRFQILTLKTRYLKGLEKLDFASSQVKR